MKRYSVLDMTKAVVMQACAAAVLEEYCDKWLGYVMHEDYLYEKENFAEEVIDKVN